MLYAAVKACPVFGGKLVSYDESKIKGRRGVSGVVRVNDTTVAVVADTWWRAKSALDALPIVWDEGAGAKQSSATIAAHLKEGLTANDAFADTNDGDALKAIAGAAKKVEAVYSTPFLSHSCMEPMNCTVRITADKAEVWMPSQNAEASLAALSTAVGLPLAQCEAYNHGLGGGFGRRGGTQDYVRQGAAIAKQYPGHPGQDDLEPRGRPGARLLPPDLAVQAVRRPRSRTAISSGCTSACPGSRSTPTSPRTTSRTARTAAAAGPVARAQATRSSATPCRTCVIEYAMRNTHVPVGPWRGVNTNQNGLYLECFIEEVARAAGKDSLEFRRALMQNHPKHLAVLNAAAEKGDWGKPLPAGVHRGIAQFMGYGSYSAAVAEVSVSGKGEVKVHRMVLALNCGHAVNPATIAAQVEGSVAYGFDSLQSEISIQKGRVVELNFHTYRHARLAQMPKVETVIVPTYDFWGGVGEPTICVVGACGAERDPRRDRQAGAHAAAQESRAHACLAAWAVRP